MAHTADRPPRVLARQLALGFGAVSVVAVAMCALLLGIVRDVSGLVAGMRRDESAIRQGRELATAVRDLSIYSTQSMLGADEAHLARYRSARERVRERIQQLAPRIPAEASFHLQALGEQTQRMHELLLQSALPAVQRGDFEAASQANHEIEPLAAQAARHADTLARVAASRMVHAHVLATDATHLGLLAGGLCVTLVLALSVGFTIHLRAAVLKPLLTLTDAAGRVGRGDFDLRLGNVGKGELSALGEAFDRMADELARRESRLLQNERMAAIGQLAAGVAHELNNPIGIIRGYLKTMTPDEDPETLGEELAILDEEAAQCQRIAEDLLCYARTRELSIERVQMRDFLEETARRFGDLPVAEDGSLEVDCEAALVEADPAGLRQVLLNLLSNARQVAPSGSPVMLRGRRDADAYVIEVSDRGPGIDPADRARVFEPFFTRRPGGSGLGLAVCSGIVRAHQGSIEVTCPEAGGARFAVRLPECQPSHRSPSLPSPGGLP